MDGAYSKSVETATPSAAYYQEPMATSQAVEVTAFAQQSELDDNSGETFRFGGWAVGFCCCCTHCVPNCCMICCCPCFSAAQIASRLGVMSFNVALIIYFIVVAVLYVSVTMVSYKSFDVYHSNYYYGSYYYGSYYYGSYYDNDARVTPAYTAYRVVVVMAEVAAFVLVWQLRAKTRERFEIPGNCFCDCCATFWCSCCTMAQMATHIKSYKPGNCDFGPPDTLPAYPQREATPDNV